jgi:hypothetical protein
MVNDFINRFDKLEKEIDENIKYLYFINIGLQVKFIL